LYSERGLQILYAITKRCIILIRCFDGLIQRKVFAECSKEFSDAQCLFGQ
jgi:hypothetical protein